MKTAQLARAITLVCQECKGDLRVVSTIPPPYGTYKCDACKRYWIYGASGWTQDDARPLH